MEMVNGQRSTVNCQGQGLKGAMAALAHSLIRYLPFTLLMASQAV
jgi:hypothetical protein